MSRFQTKVSFAFIPRNVGNDNESLRHRGNSFGWLGSAQRTSLLKGHICAMVDSCPTHLSEDEVYNMFMDNFNRHYKTNRAPFGLYFHTIWFKEKQNFKVLLRFLDDLIGNKVLSVKCEPMSRLTDCCHRTCGSSPTTRRSNGCERRPLSPN